ncbi:MAG: DUF2911 domain-containing protein [Bacteroidetes bacterium]|jgi:Protein of unknown function (DUF2911)|nr:DUF2911 domain-containing protein [Bacteroidota bacterium]
MRPLFLALALVASILATAQQKPTDLDKSPMDMSYWPSNFPMLKLSGKASGEPFARVIYGRPQKNGRVLFGDIVQYNSIWRLGANEATEIEFFVPVKIDGKLVPKGRYTLYSIPNENNWTLILNTDNFSWGNFSYNAKKDLLRVQVPVLKTMDTTEAFTLYFEETNLGAGLIILWDQVKVMLPISFSKEAILNKKK